MKARRILGLVALAAMALGTSCSNDELYNDYSPENAISFGTYVGHDAQSRASVYELDELQKEPANGGGFGVFAYYTEGNDYDPVNSKPNYMRNQLVKWNNNKWSYSPVKYWPNTDQHKLSFFAYAPYWADNANTDNIQLVPPKAEDTKGDPVVTFKVNTDVDKQVDLLFANNNNTNMTKSDVGVNKDITFNFKHALSRIGFSVEAMVDEVNDDVSGTPDDGTVTSEPLGSGTKISVSEIRLTGNFNMNGWLNLNGGGWTVPADPGQTTFILNTDDFNLGVAGNVTTTNQLLIKDDAYLMVIPTDFTSSSSKKMNITVTYQVKTYDENLYGDYSTITNVVSSGDFSIEEGLAQGKAYNFVLHLGLSSVKFSASVANWDPVNGTDYVVNVPINTTVN